MSKDLYDDYDSSFEEDDEKSAQQDKQKQKEEKLLNVTHTTIKLPAGPSGSTIPPKTFFQEQLHRAESYRYSYHSLNAYERHRKLINEYYLYYPGAAGILKRDTSKDKRDIDIVRENHRFLWDDSDQVDSWEKQLAKKYYDKLFKEYCICDLSRYKENKVAMRWRTEKEMVDGKGQFNCSEKKCLEVDELRTWEVNFAYMEEGIKKNALVKLRLCPECSLKLNHGHQRKEVTKKKHRRSSKSKVPKLKKRKVDGVESKEEDEVEEESKDPKSEQNVWKEPLLVPELKSREAEFDEYLDDLFM